MAYGGDRFQATLATYQMQVAQKVAQMKMTRLLSKAKSDPKRLEAADSLLEDGDLKTACLIYLRLALSRPKRVASETARLRLEEIQTEARRQKVLADLELEEAIAGDGADVGKVQEVFLQYEQLVSKYNDVPVVGDEIRRHVARQQRVPEFVGILDEAESRRLWTLGQQYEREQQACCAYQVYERAAELVPSPTATLAKKRLAELNASSKIIKAVAACRKLQRCHEMFQIAETVSKTDPKRASQRFRWIVEHSPRDSTIYQEARARLALE